VVKRVVGLPGDRIRLSHARVFVNGHAANEPYVVYEASYPDAFRDNFPTTMYTDPGVDTRWWIQMRQDVQNGELVVPPDMYFVLGDNRNNSRDSRYWGFVPRENIVGRPFVIYFSLWEASMTDTRPLPDDRLGSDSDKWSRLSGFARWDRMFRIVR
jgi:signal peptidase I